MDDRSIILSRTLSASPAAVWDAWTNPAKLPLWFGPEGYRCVTREIDLRPGGVWRFDMIGPGGIVFPNRHRITLYAPFSEIRFLLDDDDATTNPPIEVIVTFAPQDGGTRLVQTLILPSAEAKAGALSFGAEKLGQTTLDKLAALLRG